MTAINSTMYVSEFTRKTLQQFDWVESDPIPDSLGELLESIRSRTPASKVPGLLVDAALMSADDIALIKAALIGAKTSIAEAQRDQEIDAATAGLSEDARRLYAELLEKEVGSAPQIIDDRNTEAKPAAAPEIIPERPEVDTTPLVPAAELDPNPPAVFCPRCTWDMRKPFDVEITDDDKEAFVAITLGGERFKKPYELIAGKYVVRFRSLLAEENTTIHHQLLIDQKDGQFLSDTEWFLRMFEYRLALSVESVTINNKLTAQVPEFKNTASLELPNASDDKTKTALVRMREYVVADVLKSEVTRRLVSGKFRDFQRLCEALEAMALEPSFW